MNLAAAREIVRRALEEDIGAGDVTSRALFANAAWHGHSWPCAQAKFKRSLAGNNAASAQLPSVPAFSVPCKAVILAKEDGILAGLPVAELAFRELDPNLVWKPKKLDGARIRRGEVVAELRARLGAVLAAERVALNFLQRMSGIATLTMRFVGKTRGFPVKILDTRKTAPGLRLLDKYAVRAGGGSNHRFGLFDAVLLKDNHIRAAGGVGQAVRRASRCAPQGMKIEVEVTTLGEVEQALAARADILLLDNMSLKGMREAVRFIRHRAVVEASGGIRLENVREVAATGVDWISIGALTHSPKALDLSLEVVSA